MLNSAEELYYKDEPKSWEELCGNLQDLSDQTYDLAISRLGDRGISWLSKKSNEFLDEIRKNIEGPVSRYAAYHILVLGGSCKEKFPYLDFPGKYSLVKFYKRCQEELNKKKSDEILAYISNNLKNTVS